MRSELLAVVTAIALLGATAAITRAAPEAGSPGTTAPAGLQVPSQVSWDAWSEAVKTRIREAWSARIPQEDKGGARGAVMLRFKVFPDGRVALPETIARSGSKSLVEAAWKAIQSSAPLPIPPTVTEAGDDDLWINYTFYYNVDAQAAKDWSRRAHRLLRKRHPEAAPR